MKEPRWTILKKVVSTQNQTNRALGENRSEIPKNDPKSFSTFSRHHSNKRGIAKVSDFTSIWYKQYTMNSFVARILIDFRTEGILVKLCGFLTVFWSHLNYYWYSRMLPWDYLSTPIFVQDSLRLLIVLWFGIINVFLCIQSYLLHFLSSRFHSFWNNENVSCLHRGRGISGDWTSSEHSRGGSRWPPESAEQWQSYEQAGGLIVRTRICGSPRAGSRLRGKPVWCWIQHLKRRSRRKLWTGEPTGRPFDAGCRTTPSHSPSCRLSVRCRWGFFPQTGRRVLQSSVPAAWKRTCETIRNQEQGEAIITGIPWRISGRTAG